MTVREQKQALRVAVWLLLQNFRAMSHKHMSSVLEELAGHIRAEAKARCKRNETREFAARVEAAGGWKAYLDKTYPKP